MLRLSAIGEQRHAPRDNSGTKAPFAIIRALGEGKPDHASARTIRLRRLRGGRSSEKRVSLPLKEASIEWRLSQGNNLHGPQRNFVVTEQFDRTRCVMQGCLHIPESDLLGLLARTDHALIRAHVIARLIVGIR